MAQRVQVLILDDMDGTEGAETITYGLDGVTYEIDLGEKNAAALRKALAKFIPNSRRITKGRPQTNGRKPAAQGGSKAPSKIVRAWALEQGLEIPERGRIPESVQAQYDAAHAA